MTSSVLKFLNGAYHITEQEYPIFFLVGINKIYTKTDLMEFEHSQEVDPLNAKLPKISVRFGIDNTSDEYNPNNEAGMSKYLMERQEIRTRYGYKLGDSIEWIDGGVFYLSEWEAPQNGISLLISKLVTFWNLCVLLT